MIMIVGNPRERFLHDQSLCLKVYISSLVGTFLEVTDLEVVHTTSAFVMLELMISFQAKGSIIRRLHKHTVTLER